jgi:hypothetical protein
MAPKEALFTFMDGLSRWAKLELQRRGIHDITQVLAIAEYLYEFHLKETAKDKVKRVDQSKNEGDEDRTSPKVRGFARDKTGPGKEAKVDKPRRPIECFLCEGLHLVRDCPSRGKLAALAQEMYQDEEQRKVACMQTLSDEEDGCTSRQR